jgi:predicted nucleotidyltransferase
MNVTDEIVVKKVKECILSIDKDAEIILFGSRARGDAQEDSDWDFLFLTSLQVTPSLRERVVGKMFDVELEEHTDLQIIAKNKTVWETKYVDSPFYRNVKDDGIHI